MRNPADGSPAPGGFFFWSLSGPTPLLFPLQPPGYRVGGLRAQDLRMCLVLWDSGLVTLLYQDPVSSLFFHLTSSRRGIFLSLWLSNLTFLVRVHLPTWPRAHELSETQLSTQESVPELQWVLLLSAQQFQNEFQKEDQCSKQCHNQHLPLLLKPEASALLWHVLQLTKICFSQSLLAPMQFSESRSSQPCHSTRFYCCHDN